MVRGLGGWDQLAGWDAGARGGVCWLDREQQGQGPGGSQPTIHDLGKELGAQVWMDRDISPAIWGAERAL